jgi:uncharacterized protein YjbI with pentapeptide repeats
MSWKTACVLLMLAASSAAPTMAWAASESPHRTVPLSPRQAKATFRKTTAEADKAEGEAKKLERDNAWWVRLLSYLAPFLTVATAAAGVFFSVRKAGQDRRSAIEREAKESEEARESAEIERFDERFAKAVEGLSSAKPGAESGAAVLIASMVGEKREALSSQALQLLLVSLQTSHDEACERLLRYALERFARAAPQRLLGTDDHEPVGGLAHVRASYLDLAGLELPGLDIAFSSLRKADFSGAYLQACKGLEAHLEKARFDDADLTNAAWAKALAPGASFQRAQMSRANLHQADLSGANFYRADLRKANMRFAILHNARFRSASLEKANFFGAQFDERALDSILEAPDWQAASFSRAVQSRLEELAE